MGLSSSPAATTQVLHARDSACFGEEFTGMTSMSSDITMRCWPCLILAATFSLLDVALSLVHSETPFKYLWLLTDGHLPGPCNRFVVATGPLPAIGGRDDTWPPTSSFLCYSWRFMVPARALYVAHEQVLVRGLWEAWLGESVQQVRPTVASWQQRRSRVSLHWVAINSFSGANLLWLFWLGSCPFRCLLRCLVMVRRKSGWGICVLPFGCVFCVWWSWFATSHATTCAHVEVFSIIAYSHGRTEP